MGQSEPSQRTIDDDTRRALVELLATFGTEPRSLYDVGMPSVSRGCDQNTIVNALFDLAHDGAIELVAGNRVQVLSLSVRKRR